MLSVCNHNNLTPSQLATECGYHQCAEYINRASQAVLGSQVPTPELAYQYNGSLTHNNRVTGMHSSDGEMDCDEGAGFSNGYGRKRSLDGASHDDSKKLRRTGSNMLFSSINAFFFKQSVPRYTSSHQILK